MRRRRSTRGAVVGVLGVALAAAACRTLTAPPLDDNDGLDGGALPPVPVPPGDGGTTDSAPDAPAPGEPDASPPPPPQCPVDATWSAPVPVPELADVGAGAAVSASGLTAAWTTTDAIKGAHVLYADREPGGVFGAAQPLTYDSDGGLPLPPALGRVALSGDGLRLVYIDDALTTLVGMRRSSRAAPFAPDVSLAVDEAGEGVPAGTRQVHEPVLAPDGRSLVVSVTPNPMPPEPVDTLVLLRWDTTGLRLGGPLDPGNGALMSAATGERRIPMALSEDTLTLFYADGVTGRSAAAWRITADAPFDRVRELPDHPQAQPVAGCAELFVTVSGAGGVQSVARSTRP